MSMLAPTLQAFFSERLMRQRAVSPATIATYRDTFRLLLNFAADRVHKRPSDLDLGDLDAPLMAAFLDHLERERGNTVRTRNNRLAAIHSFFAYVSRRHPEHAASVQRVLAIPPKRFERRLITYLNEEEVDALLSACDRSTWTGRRDHAMLALTVQTGLRISELRSLTCADVFLGARAHVHCVGKGRKERRTPLLPRTVEILRAWLTERGGAPRQCSTRCTSPRRLPSALRFTRSTSPPIPSATLPPCACCSLALTPP
jgi:integrase/recombinase XerD